MPKMQMEVQRNLYGIGISPISIKNRENALDEELIANKDVGLFGIYKTDDSGDGFIYSAEYIAREKEHIKSFVHKCMSENTLGKIYKIDVDDKLVHAIRDDENLFDNECVFEFETTDITAIRFDFDIDLFARDSLSLIDSCDIKIEVQFSLMRNNITKNYVISETLENINNMAFAIDLSTLSDISEGNGIKLNTLKIIPPENFDITKNAIILHDILFAII